jgi:N-acetylmuramic acid 6-phosphate (MurNAc-6-P) etherase
MKIYAVIREMESIVTLLKIKPSSKSRDYIDDKKEFQLHNLITEQRHPITWELSLIAKNNIEKGLEQILKVDNDIIRKFEKMAQNPDQLEKPVYAVKQAVQKGRKIFIYGCGSTGRLAKQLESSIWRPFWRTLKKSMLWEKLKFHIHGDIEDCFIGEMTGGDRALISSLEGFEDLQLVGELQLKDHGIQEGDAVFCITEGGETSSVIGAVQAAAGLYSSSETTAFFSSSEYIFFIFNNPEDLVRPFQRSRAVLDFPGITKLNLTTGPQAIAGSTRMQAATSETYFMGAVLETALCEFLCCFFSEDELTGMGFDPKRTISQRLFDFKDICSVLLKSANKIAQLTSLEAATYAKGGFATYFAKKALAAVFVDCAERSPTFHLFPLDTVKEKQKRSWIQVWTEGQNHLEAWRNLLGREFRGMKEQFYLAHFKERIKDPYLKEAALRSLKHAGDSQKDLYDLSFSQANIKRRGPERGDLGVLVCVDDEINCLTEPGSSFRSFIELFKNQGAKIGLIYVGSEQNKTILKLASRVGLNLNKDVVVPIRLKESPDPLGLNRQIAIKILLNAHSTAVMAKLGRIVGNTMTNVVPSNLKLIGRATYLILSHVNNILIQRKWISRYGKKRPVTYAESNAVLFDAIDYFGGQRRQVSEVDMSVIRILEAIRSNKFVKWEEALIVAQDSGLEDYLKRI